MIGEAHGYRHLHRDRAEVLSELPRVVQRDGMVPPANNIADVGLWQPNRPGDSPLRNASQRDRQADPTRSRAELAGPPRPSRHSTAARPSADGNPIDITTEPVIDWLDSLPL